MQTDKQNNLPVITIAGRQNVGKSSLFNVLLKKRKSIIYDHPGVTRDILRETVIGEDGEAIYEICDSPGLDVENTDTLTADIIEVSFVHLLASDLILYVLNKKELTEYDYKLVSLFRKDKRFHNKQILYVVNKCDKPEDDDDLEEFYRLGLSELLPLSVTGRRNIKILQEKIQFSLGEKSKLTGKQYDFRLSIIGKPNSGKSTLLNSIAGKKTSVVSEVSGTTRDPVKTIIHYLDKKIELVDTAGIRKKSKTSEAVEFYSYRRTLETVSASDIVILLIDAMTGFGDYDKKIYAMIQKSGKPVLVLFNKWDLLKKEGRANYEEYIDKVAFRFPPLKDAPAFPLSAIQGNKSTRILDECIDLYNRSGKQIQTSELNKKLKEWGRAGRLPVPSGKAPKIYYATQIGTRPIRFAFFVNKKENFQAPLIHYYINKIVKEYSLSGIPVNVDIRAEERKK